MNIFDGYGNNIQWDLHFILKKVIMSLKKSNETYLKDIIESYHIEKIQGLDDLVNILSSAIGSLTNPPKIEATFKSTIQSPISLNTIRQYIEYLEDTS